MFLSSFSKSARIVLMAFALIVFYALNGPHRRVLLATN